MKLRRYSATKRATDECDGLNPESWANTSWLDFKPPSQHVVWLSVGAAWMKWVKAEMPQWAPKYAHWRGVHVDSRQMIIVDTAR